MNDFILGWEQPEELHSLGFMSREVHEPTEDTLVIDPSDNHLLVIAGTGAGKGRSVAIPNLLHWDGPAIVLDIKGELAETTLRYRRDELGQEVVVLDPWHVTRFPAGSLNPLCAVGHGEALGDDCFLMASFLSPPTGMLADPFWQERAEALIAGVMAHVATDPGGNHGLDQVHKWLHGEDVSYNLATLLDTCAKSTPRFATEQVGAFLQTEDKCRSGILASAQSIVRILGGDLVRAAASTTSFDLEKVESGAPMTIYIVVPPAFLYSHSPLIRMWITSLLSQITARKAAPTKSTLLLLDEAAQYGDRMPQIQAAITLARSYGMRVALFLQSYAQLVRMYPIDHSVIFENCGTVLAMGLSRQKPASLVADALGDISTDRLMRMRLNEAAVNMPYQKTRVVRKLDYLKDKMFEGRFDANPMYANRGR